MYERSRKVSRKGSENLDKHLLEALYHRYYKELYIFVYSLCGSETVTDDILQDTFLKALLALKDSHTNMRAWFYMVARNLYYNYYNRQKNLFSIETEEVDRRNSREKIISGEGEAFIQNDILEEILHKEEKKEGVGCCEPPERTEEGSNTITVFWRFFAKRDCSNAKNNSR